VIVFLFTWVRPVRGRAPVVAVNDQRTSWGRVGSFVQLGTTLFGCVVVGLAGGYGVDALLGTPPWFLLIGLLLGIVAAGVNLYRAIVALGRMGDTETDQTDERR
jgi:F0F1-type ATP synthase assembly protein I